MTVIVVILSLASLVVAPFLAAKVMGLKGGLGKGALVGFVTLGLMQIIGMVGEALGPLGGTLGLMGFIAAWYQVVKVVHGTDTAKTIVFMFWHMFFFLLCAALIQLVLGQGVSWLWRG